MTTEKKLKNIEVLLKSFSPFYYTSLQKLDTPNTTPSLYYVTVENKKTANAKVNMFSEKESLIAIYLDVIFMFLSV